MREAYRDVATADLDYGDPRGSGALREVVAGYLRRVRAAAAGPADLIVCTGFAQGLNLVLRVLVQLGVERVAFEDPGHGDVETSTSVRSKTVSDRGSSALDQLALAALLTSGRYDRHLRRMRGTYARRRTALIEALGRHAPAVRLTGLAAGFHAVAHLPGSADEDEVVAQARRRSVGLYGMAPFRASHGTAPPQLVLGFGLVNERAIEAGIAAVADLLR